MAQFDLPWLARLLEECGDRDAMVDINLAGDIGAVSFDELGFDSLSLFNTVARIERDHLIALPLDPVLAAKTPAALLDLVNQHAARSA